MNLEELIGGLRWQMELRLKQAEELIGGLRWQMELRLKQAVDLEEHVEHRNEWEEKNNRKRARDCREEAATLLRAIKTLEKDEPKSERGTRNAEEGVAQSE